MTTPRQFAEAFSGHRFREVYPALAPDVRWTSPGQFTLTGRDATAEFRRFLVIAEGDSAAVDAIGRYVDAEGEASLVSSCDV